MGLTPEKEAVDKIPVLDISKLCSLTRSEFEINDKNPEIRQIADEFRDALHETGFVYLVNHGIKKETISNAFTESKMFFDLPMEQKMKYLKCKETADTNFHGYISPGHEVLKKDGLTERIQVEKKEAFDIFLPMHRRYPTEEAPTFQGVMESMEDACKELDTKLLKLLAISVGLDDPDFFLRRTTHLKDPNNAPTRTVFRTIFYPSIPIDPIGERDDGGKSEGQGQNQKVGYVGCNEHTDWDLLTLLFQDSVGGLEIKSKDGRWIPAKPIPNAIVVNTGDLLEAWTGGYFKATPHRVRVYQTEDQLSVADAEEGDEGTGSSESGNTQKSRGRQSIAYFLFPDDDALVLPVPSDLIQQNCGQEFLETEPFTSYDHFSKKAREAYAQY